MQIRLAAKPKVDSRAAQLAHKIPPESSLNPEQPKVRFSKIIKNRKSKVRVTIYG